MALGVLYAGSSRRYLDVLSTYTRCRMTQAVKAQMDEVLYVPASLTLHQRPDVPGIRTTFGTGTELLSSLQLMFSRLANHCCPNGHYLNPRLLSPPVRNSFARNAAAPDFPLHPSNIAGLIGVRHDLIADGNSVVLVGSKDGGHIVTVGTPEEVAVNQHSITGKYFKY